MRPRSSTRLRNLERLRRVVAASERADSHWLVTYWEPHREGVYHERFGSESGARKHLRMLKEKGYDGHMKRVSGPILRRE